MSKGITVHIMHPRVAKLQQAIEASGGVVFDYMLDELMNLSDDLNKLESVEKVIKGEVQ
ncbi:hypothetical protein NVP1121O_216 [Vibrio phage 1.121.O._10N.286.46.C4]|nr:hypothetical protein NVP1121O_216 [Vibrio phage 1.121.O._10N.286.46.C4]